MLTLTDLGSVPQMLTRHLDDVTDTPRDVHGPGWRSRRLIVAEDGLDYSFHVTILDEGVSLRFEYENHRETVYCISGEGQIDDLATGEVFSLNPGSVYSVGAGEPHLVTAFTEMELVCVFNPPLTGTEEAD
jgi:L-ectoine synthase